MSSVPPEWEMALEHIDGHGHTWVNHCEIPVTATGSLTQPPWIYTTPELCSKIEEQTQVQRLCLQNEGDYPSDIQLKATAVLRVLLVELRRRRE